MPQQVPSKESIEPLIRLLTAANPQGAQLIGQLSDAARINFDEANAASQQIKTLQTQAATAERTVAELQARFGAADKQTQEKTAQAARLESDLRDANARLAEGAARIAALQVTSANQVRDAQEKQAGAEHALSDLQARFAEADRQARDKIGQAAKLESDLQLATARLTESVARIATLEKTVADLRGSAATGARPITDLVRELHADASTLFAKPIRSPEAPQAPGVIVDGLEFEIRGDLAIGDKIGLRTFAPDRAGPEAASVVRFSLKPEMRVEVPDEEKK